MMNTYLKYQPPAVQFLAFMMLTGGFFILDFAVNTIFFREVNEVLLQSDAVVTADIIAKSKLAQFTASLLWFFCPALLFGYYSSPKALDYVGLRNKANGLLIACAIVLLFAFQPFITWLGELNARVNFGAMQQTLLQKEELYNRVMKAFLQMHGPADLFINIFIMALLPAIGEELFFRGALQKVVLRLTKSPVVAICVSSIVFALLHLTIFKALPILVLGVTLGILYHFTKNLWYNIIIHFLNNAFAVLMVYFSVEDPSFPSYLGFVSLVVSVLVIYFFWKKTRQEAQVIETSEDNDYIA